jgi:LEA14-like dessication related protein
MWGLECNVATMKNFLKLILVLVILVIAGVAIWWFTLSRKSGDGGKDESPVLAIASMSIKDINSESIDMECGIVIDNPIPIQIEADSLNYELWIDSVQVMKDTYAKKFVIKKNDSILIRLPVTIRQEVLKKVIKKFDRTKADSADYSFRTSFRPQIPIVGKREITIRSEKRLPAIRGIAVEIDKIRIHHLGLKKSSIGVDVVMTNRNAFPIKISNGEYDVKIEDDMKMHGEMEKHISVPPRGSQNISMEIDVGSMKLPKLGWKMLFEKNTTKFDFKFKGKIDADQEMLDDADISMSASGTIADMKKLKE